MSSSCTAFFRTWDNLTAVHHEAVLTWHRKRLTLAKLAKSLSSAQRREQLLRPRSPSSGGIRHERALAELERLQRDIDVTQREIAAGWQWIQFVEQLNDEFVARHARRLEEARERWIEQYPGLFACS